MPYPEPSGTPYPGPSGGVPSAVPSLQPPVSAPAGTAPVNSVGVPVATPLSSPATVPPISTPSAAAPAKAPAGAAPVACPSGFVCRSDGSLYVPAGASITVEANSTQTLNSPIVVAGNLTVASGGTLVLGTNVTGITIESGGCANLGGVLVLNYDGSIRPVDDSTRQIITNPGQSGCVNGRFDSISVVPDVCESKTSATANYEGKSLSVLFDVAPASCDGSTGIGAGPVPPWGIALIVIGIVAILIVIAIIIGRSKRGRKVFQPFFERRESSVRITQTAPAEDIQ